MVAQNLPSHRAFGVGTVDLLQRLGKKVDFAAPDWGRGQKGPLFQGAGICTL
jgi:hypothetical protein